MKEYNQYIKRVPFLQVSVSYRVSQTKVASCKVLDRDIAVRVTFNILTCQREMSQLNANIELERQKMVEPRLWEAPSDGCTCTDAVCLASRGMSKSFPFQLRSLSNQLTCIH